MDWVTAIICVLGGAAVGAAITAIVCMMRRHSIQGELSQARVRAELLDQQAQSHLDEINRARGDLKDSEKSRETAERQAAVTQEKLTAQQKQFEEQRKSFEEAKAALKDTFRALSGDALTSNNEQFLKLAEQKLAPFKDLLDKQNKAVVEIEQKREKAYGSIEQQIKSIADSHQRLSTETGRLVKALRRPEQRGRWGEMQLRNAVEMAGMTAHCDFDEQVTIWNGESTQRPDMLINLAQRGAIPVDSKVAIDAYLDAIESEDSDAKLKCLERHADQVEKHFKALANKRYWDGFEKGRAPQVVVMFMPLESALVAALDVRPELHSQAMQQNVLIATPTLLVALLRAVAYGWQQDALAKNSQEIGKIGAELYSRMQKFVGDLEKLGRGLSQASSAYNAAIGSLDSRVMPSMRKLKEKHAAIDEEIESPALIEVDVRPIAAGESKGDTLIAPM